MNLLLIIDDYLPESTKVGAKMMHELAVELKSNGHEVSVLTPKPLQKESLTVQKIDGINILFFRSGRIKNVGKLKRAINESLLSYQAFKSSKKYLKDNPCNGIIYYSPSIFFGSLVKKLSSLWNCQSYLILRDIFPQWSVDNNLLIENSLVHRYFNFFEKINYKSADRIGVMSPSNLEFFKSKSINTSKFEVLYNWSQITEVPNVKNNFRKKLKLENKIVLFYGGNIGHAQQMTNLINLAKNFTENNSVHFLFVGQGDEVELLLKEVSNNKLKNITYLPPVNQNTYFEMLNEFDIGMFSLHSGHKTHNFPGKLLGYMSYSKPILGCVNDGNDLADIVNSAKAGIVVNSKDDLGLYEAAKALIDSKSIRNKMGANGRELLLNKFSVKSISKQIVNNL
jgi:O26-antigen biosynthesis N-acetyl-L-fucosamine transferase